MGGRVSWVRLSWGITKNNTWDTVCMGGEVLGMCFSFLILFFCLRRLAFERKRGYLLEITRRAIMTAEREFLQIADTSGFAGTGCAVSYIQGGRDKNPHQRRRPQK